MGKKISRGASQHFYKRKAKAMSDKLLHNVSVGSSRKEVRFKRSQRQDLRRRSGTKEPREQRELKVGAFNVNGLDVEASWAVEKLLVDRDFDVSIGEIC